MGEKEDILASAREAFGSTDNATDVDVLCLRVSQLQRHSSERNEALNCNGRQAQQIAKQSREIAALRARVYVLKDALRDCHLHLREIYNNVSENDEEGALIERARAALEEK